MSSITFGCKSNNGRTLECIILYIHIIIMYVRTCVYNFHFKYYGGHALKVYLF